MISETKIVENYNTYKNLLRSTGRKGIEDLIEFLDTTDFSVAPASAKYHSNFKGGLCAHSLNVYHNIMMLNEKLGLDCDIKSLTIISLLHDLAKVDYYEKYIQNKKDYNQYGKQSDAVGRFDWIQVESYKVLDAMSRLYVCGEHGLNSFMIASKYIDLSDMEAACIINHHMSLDNGRPRTDISEIMNRYPEATILCNADMIASYIDENPYRIDE